MVLYDLGHMVHTSLRGHILQFPQVYIDVTFGEYLVTYVNPHQVILAIPLISLQVSPHLLHLVLCIYENADPPIGRSQN